MCAVVVLFFSGAKKLQCFQRLRGCRGSGVEHPLGKGEVESSNLSGSTIDIPLGRNVAPKLLILLDAR